MIKLTIATPVYNRQDCIIRCIDSVISQSVLPFEMLIVDDGSTDSTVEIIKKYQQKYSFIKLWIAPENAGVNNARNRLIENTSGDFILWLDSDDWLAENSLVKINEVMINNSEYDHYLFIPDDRAEYIEKHPLLSKESHLVTFPEWASETVTGDYVHVVRKDSFNGMLFFENTIGSEGLNWLRVIKKEEKMFFYNFVAVHRERARPDSHIHKTRLTNEVVILKAIEKDRLYIDLYFDDLLQYNPVKLSRFLMHCIVLGIAAGKNKDNIILLSKLKTIKGVMLKHHILKILNFLRTKNLAFWLIKRVSESNNNKRNIK